MDDELETTIYPIVDEAIARTPEEVLDFIQSPTYGIILSGIQKIIGLTDGQKEIVNNGAYNILLQLKTSSEVFDDFVQSGMDEELAAKSLYAIQTEIVTRAINITEFFTDGEEESIQPASVTQEEVRSAPTPSDVLATLGERLAKARVVAPMKRSEAPNNLPTPSAEPRKSIDPYREIPEV